MPVWASQDADLIQRAVLEYVNRTPKANAVRVGKVQVVAGWATAEAVEVTEKKTPHQFLLQKDKGDWAVVADGSPALSPNQVEKSRIPEGVAEKLALSLPPPPDEEPSPVPNPEALHYLCAASDVRPLVLKDLYGKSPKDLTLMRNEIFARHGRWFTDPMLQDYFRAQPWYSPNPQYSDDLLSPLERSNAKFIEKYQADHHLKL